MNVFKEMGCAVGKVSAYPKFLKNKKGKVFGYSVLLLFFYFILAYIIPCLVFQARTGGFGKILDEYIPEFELYNGSFYIEDPVYFNSPGQSYVDIDTTEYFDVDDAYDFAYGYASVIIMDEEKIFLKSNGQVQSYYYSQLDLEFDRSDLESWIPLIYVSILFGLLFIYIFAVALFFFGVLFVGLIGLVFSSIQKADLTFGQVYLLGIYSRTLSLGIKGLVKLLESATAITIPYFWVINFGISLIYLYMAIKHAKKEQEQSGMGQQGMYGGGYIQGQGGSYGAGYGQGQGGSYGAGYGQGQGGSYGTGYGQGQGGSYGTGQGQGGSYGNGYGQGGSYGTGYGPGQGGGYQQGGSGQTGSGYGQGSSYGQDPFDPGNRS